MFDHPSARFSTKLKKIPLLVAACWLRPAGFFPRRNSLDLRHLKSVVASDMLSLSKHQPEKYYCSFAQSGPHSKVSLDNIKIRFGSRVKARRRSMGISQEELAERAGLHRTYVCEVESGRRNISLESIDRLARALETPVSRLLSAPPPLTENGTEELFSPDELVDILYVEDRADDVELALEALKAAKITNRIHVVRDGAEALHFLFCTGPYAQRRPTNRPQLILLDLGLPKVGGLEVLRRIKADLRTCEIPVIVLTASDRDRDIATSKKLGAEDYIVKPVDFQTLSEVTPKLSLQWALLKQLPRLVPVGG